MTSDPVSTPTRFDFRKPARMASETEEYLDQWTSNFCVQTVERLREKLTFDLTCCSSTLETARPATVLGQLPDPAFGFRVAFGEDGPQLLFVLPRTIVIAIVNGMLGEEVLETPEDRDLTAVEHTLAELMMHDLLRAITDSMPGEVPQPCCLDRMEPRPSRTRMFADGNAVMSWTFEIGGPFGTAHGHWILGQPTVEELLERNQPPKREVDQEVLELLEEHVSNIPVELVVRLGETTLKLDDLTKLRAGDVVVLDQSINQPLKAQIGGSTRFEAWPGHVGVRQAIIIDSLIEN